MATADERQVASLLARALGQFTHLPNEGIRCVLVTGPSLEAARRVASAGPVVPVERLAMLADEWEATADRHRDGGIGEGTAADTLAACARSLREVISDG